MKVLIPGETVERWIEAQEGKTTGEVRFVLDDRKLSPTVVAEIEELFLKRFRLPLNRPINPAKFTLGKARLLDFLFAADIKEKLPLFHTSTLEELHQRNLISYSPVQTMECRACRVVAKDDTTKTCPKCGLPLQPGAPVTRLSPHQGVFEEARRLVEAHSGWEMVPHRQDHGIIVDGNEYRVFSVRNRKVSKNELAVYVTTSLPTSATVSRLQAYPAPLFLIYVGKAAVGRQRDHLALLHGETLGQLMAWEHEGVTEELSKALKTALLAGEVRLRVAIQRARTRVRELVQGRLPEEYTFTSFEDDCWALLRGIMDSVVKWGADKPKKAVPDGFFDYTYEHSIEAVVNRAWTYDAKLSESMTEGYDFPQAEKRKIVEYMTNAAVNTRLKKYLGKPGFTGHLLISNKFKESDIPRIHDYVFTQAPHLSGRVLVRFMDIGALLELSEWVELHSADIQSRPNIFLNKLDAAFQGEPSHISLDKVQKILASVLKEETERDPLDTDKLAREIAK